MRILIYVPIIHTSADLGSLAGDVTKRGIADLGEDVWKEHQRTVEGLWDAISHYFDSMDVSGNENISRWNGSRWRSGTENS